jgi:hypothetical protein
VDASAPVPDPSGTCPVSLRAHELLERAAAAQRERRAEVDGLRSLLVALEHHGLQGDEQPVGSADPVARLRGREAETA